MSEVQICVGECTSHWLCQQLDIGNLDVVATDASGTCQCMHFIHGHARLQSLKLVVEHNLITVLVELLFGFEVLRT